MRVDPFAMILSTMVFFVASFTPMPLAAAHDGPLEPPQLHQQRLQAPPHTLHWVDAAMLVQNTGMAMSVPRPPFGRLPNAAKSGDFCDPPCPVRDEGV